MRGTPWGGHHGGKGGHFTLLRTLSVEVVYLVVYRGHHEGNGGHFTLLRTLRVEVVYLVVYRGHHEGKGGRKHRSGGVSGGVWGTPWGMGQSVGVWDMLLVHAVYGTKCWYTRWMVYSGRHTVGTRSVWGTSHDLGRHTVGRWMVYTGRHTVGTRSVWGTAEFQGRQNVGMRGSTARAKASSPKSMSTVGIEPTPPPQEPKGCYHYTMRTLQQCPSST
ncbi:hypothetical protein C8F04DRAFT_1200845 [Mycena alexandri]|uniref:Uncharacterized protein n=1 Tax=Mycena alexandri TaxID=1745969 RepID=A0AAD6WQI6_9AGAR|nr:hypothetical protein C8F04DRAFT_1200845 [Mycena alexandri]